MASALDHGVDSVPTFHLDWKKGRDIFRDITWCKAVTAGLTTFVAYYSNFLSINFYGTEMDMYGLISEELVPPTLFFGLGDFRGHLILVGGRDIHTNESSDIVTEWRYPDQKYYNPYPPMIYPRVDPLVVSWGDYLIVIGGVADNSATQTMEVFNADKDVYVWKEAGEIPVSTLLSAVVIDNETLYLLGDLDKLFSIFLPKLVSTIPSPTSSSDSLWKYVMDMPFEESTIFSYRNHLLCIGGYTGSQSTDDSEYTPVSDMLCLSNEDDKKWVKVGDVPHGCYKCCCVSIPVHNAILMMSGKSDRFDPLLLKKVYRTYNAIGKT